VPVTTETVFKIGSVSKPIIAMGIMSLIEEGKISLDDKVSLYLDGTPEAWKDITVRHLLSHTSGIVREAPGFDGAKIQADSDVIKTAYPLPLGFMPGEKYEYCNVGYFSLAQIIRKVTGKPWGEFLAERIFKPFGMSATRTTVFDEIVPNRSNAYSFQNGKLSNAEVYLALRPSGAFLSTVLDLAKLEAALDGANFLKPETRKTMWTPFKFNNGTDSVYGLGWTLDAVKGKKRIHHGGSLNGFKSEFARFPDDRITVIVLTNLNEAMPSEIAARVAAFYIPALAKAATN
jgi:CubicO group peptidase (beta-lactamase class C family)